MACALPACKGGCSVINSLKIVVMEPVSKFVFIISVSIVAIGTLIVWLVYRNIKDKQAFEKSMNDPKRIVEKHPEEKM
jgi:hypothetical protein